MSEEIKPGDRIRWKMDTNGVRTNGALDLTAAYVGERVCVYHWQARTGSAKGEGSMPRLAWDRDIEKIPDFFEVGKTYHCAGDVFTPTVVEKDGGGDPVAFGKLTSPRGEYAWVAKRGATIFSVWSESWPMR